MRMRPLSGAFVVALIAFLSSSCGGDGGTPPPPALVPTGASALADAQTAVAGTTLPSSITVIVTDQNGSLLPGVTITWAVATGAGTVDPASSTTGADGAASTAWTLGPTVGQQTVTATVPILGPLVFTSTAVAGDAAGVAVTPGTVDLGALGATSQLTAMLVDAHGNAVAGGTFTWGTSDAALVTVSETGLATAVANGTATITATSDLLSGTGAVVVQQVAATVLVTPADPTLAIGMDQAMTAVVRDANGNALAGATVGWTSSDPAVATVSATGVLTGMAEGTVTITAISDNATGTTTVTVILVPLPFEPLANQSISGTLNVAQVTIPAGVTISATSDLVLNATGPVTIDGTLAGNCVGITLNSQADITITGTVENACDLPAAGTDGNNMVITGQGTINLTGAQIMSTGDVEIDNLEASAAPQISTLSFGSRTGTPDVLGARAAIQSRDCRVESSVITAGENRALQADDGEAGRSGAFLSLKCGENATLLDATFAAGDGQFGGDVAVIDGDAVGGDGGIGGSILLQSTGKITFGTVTFRGGSGGRGGHAESTSLDPAIDAEARGGVGGPAGEPRLIASAIEIGPSGIINVIIQDGGNGGDAVAKGANAPPGVPGGQAFAMAGAGGGGRRLGEPLPLLAPSSASGIIAGDFLTEAMKTQINVTAGHTGNGGNAVGSGGKGGDGVAQSKNGFPGGLVLVSGGEGIAVTYVDNRVMPPTAIGTPGNGGDGTYENGGGGFGINGCVMPGMLPSGNGGSGGDASTFPGPDAESPRRESAGRGGLGPTVNGTNGKTIFNSFGNGGSAGPLGDAPGVGGAAGNNHSIAPGLVEMNGINFAPGFDGGPCTFTFDIAVAVFLDPNGHDPFTGATSVDMFRMMIFADGFESGDVSAWGSTTGTFSDFVPGASGAASSPSLATISFSGTGIGTVAGFPDVDHTLDGTLTLDAGGRPLSFTATLVLDANNDQLPANMTGQRNPVSYTLTATLPPAGN